MTPVKATQPVTEAVGIKTDLAELVRQAIVALRVRFPDASIVYYEEEGGLWKARVWSDDLSPEMLAVISAGLPGETPLIAEVIRTRQSVFTDAWDPEQQGVESSEPEFPGIGGMAF